MPLFDAITTTGTGMDTYQTWIDAISNNIANVNTVRPTSEDAFEATYVVAQANSTNSSGIGTGVHVQKLSSGDAVGRETYQPTNPLADSKGYVRLPDIDLSEQMGDLIMAQRGVQANASVLDRVKQSYQAAIDIGKSERS